MKKILALTAVATLAISAFGQGIVQFNNLSPTRFNIRDSDGTTGLAGSGFRAALLGGAVGSTAWSVSTSGVVSGSGLSLLTSPDTGNSWLSFRTGAGAGVVAGGDPNRTVTGVNWGGSAVIQMVAWSGTSADWSSAVSAALTPGSGVRIGASNPITVTLPTGPTDPNLAYLVGMQSFNIIAVPEPSTLALLGLGAVSLLAIRRRK